MRADQLEPTLKRLGLVFILGLFLQLRIDERQILLPIFATVALRLLWGLRPYRALSASAGFTGATVAAAVVAVAGFIGWLPPVEPGAASLVIVLAIALGSAAYATAIGDWCDRQQWPEPAAKARSACRWSLAVAAVTVAETVALLVLVAAGPAEPDSAFTPSVVLGRPLQGWGAVVAILGVFAVWVVATVKLRAMSQLVRSGLRALGDAPLVDA